MFNWCGLRQRQCLTFDYLSQYNVTGKMEGMDKVLTMTAQVQLL